MIWIWKVSALNVHLLGELQSEGRWLDLRVSQSGHWRTQQGETLSLLEGCRHVDLSITPFTNTLPIRQLGLQVGELAEIEVVYVALPEMQLSCANQRYTRLAENVYRYEDQSFPGGFTADLPVDDDGLVLDYPGLFKRVQL